MLKKSIIKITFAFFAVFILTGTATARELMQLSLDSARQYALEHNRNLVIAGLAIDQADERLRETISQGLPQVNATVDYNNFFGSTAEIAFGPVPAVIEFNPTSNANLSVGQLIFSGSYIVGIQTARLFREISETSRERTELEIISQVLQAYYLVLVSEQSRDILEANLENMKDVMGKTRAMVDAGIAEDLDYDQLSVQANMLENGLNAARRQVELSVNMLRLQLGLDAEVELTLTNDLDDIVSRADFQGSLLNPFSLDESIDFQLIQLQTSIAGKQINLERAAYLPTVMGFYNYTEKLLKPEFDITPKHVIGLNVSIPIFSSGARRSRVNQARINHQSVENQKELVADQLLIQERQLRYNLSNAMEQFESQKENVAVAQRVFDNIRLKYQQGLLSSLDLTTANNNYLQAETGYISALMQLLQAQTEMDKLLNII
jgi:outer membrane protein